MLRDTIPYGCQSIDEDDIEAVIRVLRSEWLTQGPMIEPFEQAVASECGAACAVAVSNATAALHLACLALSVGPGDIVWTSPLSFVASANCARYVGATVDFVDIDPITGNMCPVALGHKLRQAQASGHLPKLVIPVHFAGRACDMRAISALQAQYGFHVIEDAAHAQGAAYADGSPVGSHAQSQATIFSFHPVKPITTGEGGMVVASSPAFADKVRLLRSHGITRDPVQLKQQNMPAWYYEQQTLGFNYRLTDFQAALGTSQMRKLPGFIERRRELARRYREKLHLPQISLPPGDDTCGWHLYVIQVPGRRDEVFSALREQKIGVNVHYIPIHLQPDYATLGFKPGQFPQAELFYSGCLSLPLHPSLTYDEQDRVITTLRIALQRTATA